MTTTTSIWDDPFTAFLACVTATAASAMVLMIHVTIPYVMMPTVELWVSYVLPLFETSLASPGAVIEAVGAGVVVAVLLPFFATLSAALVLAFVPLTITVGVPLVVSYAFWIRLVYERVLGGGPR